MTPLPRNGMYNTVPYDVGTGTGTDTGAVYRIQYRVVDGIRSIPTAVGLYSDLSIGFV